MKMQILPWTTKSLLLSFISSSQLTLQWAVTTLIFTLHWELGILFLVYKPSADLFCLYYYSSTSSNSWLLLIFQVSIQILPHQRGLPWIPLELLSNTSLCWSASWLRYCDLYLTNYMLIYIHLWPTTHNFSHIFGFCPAYLANSPLKSFNFQWKDQKLSFVMLMKWYLKALW